MKFSPVIPCLVCLLSALAGCTDLAYDALSAGHTDTFIRMVKGKTATELEAYRRGQDSYMSIAVRSSDLKAVNYLLEKGYNANLGDTNGTSPLEMAAYQGYVDIGLALLQAGANIESRSTQVRMTPLITSAWKDRTEMAIMLVRHGADVSAIDANGNNALHQAKRRKNAVLIACFSNAAAC